MSTVRGRADVVQSHSVLSWETYYNKVMNRSKDKKEKWHPPWAQTTLKLKVMEWATMIVTSAFILWDWKNTASLWPHLGGQGGRTLLGNITHEHRQAASPSGSLAPQIKMGSGVNCCWWRVSHSATEIYRSIWHCRKKRGNISSKCSKIAKNEEPKGRIKFIKTCSRDLGI